MNKHDARIKLKKQRQAMGLCVYCGIKKHLNNKKGCSACLKNKYNVQKKYYLTNKDKCKLYRQKIKTKVIEKYGGKCACCGETKIEFLVIDHINNDGGKERKQKYGSQFGASYSWYLELKRMPIRKDLQVLCYNCNAAKSIYGNCPHKKEYVPLDLNILNIDNRKKQHLNIGCKIVWPDDEILIEAINKYNCTTIANILGVHVTAIIGRLKRRDLYSRIERKDYGKSNKEVDSDTIQKLMPIKR